MLQIYILGWSDIYGLDHTSPEDSAGFAESMDRVAQIIQSEIDAGIDSKRIVIAGFSQGGAVALHTSLRLPYEVGGCLALSTWLPLRDDYPSALFDRNRQLRILQIHGDEDRVVSHHWGKLSHELIKSYILQPTPEFITIEVCYYYLLKILSLIINYSDLGDGSFI
jgi:predicted esterase